MNRTHECSSRKISGATDEIGGWKYYGIRAIAAKIANDQRPAISMILPIFNMEKHLRECIDSILAQTFSDFEVILVNDGSNRQQRGYLQNVSVRCAVSIH